MVPMANQSALQTQPSRGVSMVLSFHDDRGIAVIDLTGGLDETRGAELGALFDRLLTEGRRQFVIDLKAVDFIDSAGLAMLVRCFKRVRSGVGNLALIAPQPSVRRIFELTRLDRSFDIHTDVAEAVQRFTGSQR
jgi:anti-anti-sigma factor